jgi:hypothetical protein
MTADLPPDHTPSGASTGAGNAAAPPEVQVMFDRIAGRYDLMNLLISAFQEPRWRRRLVAHAGLMPGGSALDVASGTGKVAADLHARVGQFGRVLGVGGHVTALRRTRSGPFSLADARPLDEVLATLEAPGGKVDEAALPMVAPADALRHLERRVVTDSIARDARFGRRIALEPGEAASDGRLCLLDSQGKLVAVAQPRPDQTLELLRVFLP